MGFKTWYLNTYIRKKKLSALGIVLIILSITILTTMNIFAYFHMAKRNEATDSIHSRLIRIWFDSYISYDEIEQIDDIDGILAYFPAVNKVMSITVEGDAKEAVLYFMNSSDLESLLRFFGMSYIGSLPVNNSILLGYHTANALGVIGKEHANVRLDGVSCRISGISSVTYSIFDQFSYGDIEFYWRYLGSEAENHLYNSLFIILDSSVREYEVMNSLEKLFSIKYVFTPSNTQETGKQILEKQLSATAFLDFVFWGLGLLIVSVYLSKDLSNRRKELTMLRVLGSTTNQIFGYLILYILLLTFVGYLIGFILAIKIVYPIYEKFAYGYFFIVAPDTYLKTFLASLLPITALNLILVFLTMKWIGRIRPMEVLRAEV